MTVTVTVLRDRDEAQWSDLYREHTPYIRAVARRIVGDQDAEDVCQEVWLRVLATASEHAGRSSLRTWLHSIAVHLCLDLVRSRGKLVQLDSELVDYIATEGDTDLAAATARVDVDTMMVTLSERERQLLQLRYLDGMSDREVAEHLGEHEEAVKTAVRRARGKLRFRYGAIVRRAEA